MFTQGQTSVGLTCRDSSWRDSAVAGVAVSERVGEISEGDGEVTWHCRQGERESEGGKAETDLVLAGKLIALDLPGSEKGSGPVCYK